MEKLLDHILYNLNNMSEEEFERCKKLVMEPIPDHSTYNPEVSTEFKFFKNKK